MVLTYADVAALVTAGKTDAEIAAALPQTAAWWRPLTSLEALRWLAIGGRMARLQDAAANNQTPAELRGAMAATLIAVERADARLDLSPGSDDRTLLLGCVQAGIFAAEDVAELIDSTRLRPDPTEADVAACRQAEADRQAAVAQQAALEAYRQRLEAKRVALADAVLLAMDAATYEDTLNDEHWASVKAAVDAAWEA